MQSQQELVECVRGVFGCVVEGRGELKSLPEKMGALVEAAVKIR